MSVSLLWSTNVIGWFWKNIKNNYKISEKSTNKVKIKAIAFMVRVSAL